jgi:transporter family-2 protein
MLAAAALMRGPLPTAGMLARTSWMSWTGGLFGAMYIAVSIFLLPRLGAATLIALLVGGQMLGSLAFDHFGVLGLSVQHVSLTRSVGAALLVAGVMLIRL